jgi:hypothetical protein
MYCWINKISGQGARVPPSGYSGRAAAARSQRLWRPGAQALKLDRLQATWYKIL